MSAIKKNKQPNAKEIPVHLNNNLPSLWIDMVNVAIREDDICMLRSFTNTPEGYFEQSRITTHKDIMKNLVDVLCSNLNYYPKEKVTKAKKKSKATK